MTEKDFDFFIGWSIAAFVATALLNVVGTLMDKISFVLHIACGIICVLSAISSMCFIVLKRNKFNKDNENGK